MRGLFRWIAALVLVLGFGIAAGLVVGRRTAEPTTTGVRTTLRLLQEPPPEFSRSLRGCPDDTHALAVSDLAPPRAQVWDLWRIPANTAAPAQILVHWGRGGYLLNGSGAYYDANIQDGLVLWSPVSRKPPDLKRTFDCAVPWRAHVVLANHWRDDTAKPEPRGLDLYVDLADATGDGHRDVLVTSIIGNHICGPRVVVAAFGTRVRTIFRRDFCETYMTAQGGRLLFDEAHYVKDDSLCCPSFRHRFALRWDGSRLVTVANRLVPTPIR